MTDATDPITWLQTARKLDGALLVEMGVAEVAHPKLGRAISFPYRKNGKPYAAKFRTIEKRFLSSTGVTRELYNLDALSEDQDQPVVIVEGEIDCLTVIQSGFIRSVSLPDGWTEDGGKTESLLAAEELLRKSPYVIVAGDNDKAGASLPTAVANILSGHDVRYAEWPKGCKDASDVLMAFGEGAVAECLNKAKRIDPPGGTITGFADLPPHSDERILKIGREPFDSHLAFAIGEVSVSTGVPGSGKSTFATWAFNEVSMNEKIRVGNIGLETHPYRVRDQLARIHTHKPWRELPASQRESLLQDIDRRWRMVTIRDEFDLNLGWFDAMLRTLVIRDRCKVVIIDPWNEMDHMPEKGEMMTDYVNFALRHIRRKAKQYECHVHIVAHPKMMQTQGGIKPPTGYDIAGSAAFFNKPGLGFTIHPGSESFRSELITWKVRDALLYGCRKGRVEVEFAEQWGLFRGVDAQAESPQMGLSV
jgi:twinkle protein